MIGVNNYPLFFYRSPRIFHMYWSYPVDSKNRLLFRATNYVIIFYISSNKHTFSLHSSSKRLLIQLLTTLQMTSFKSPDTLLHTMIPPNKSRELQHQEQVTLSSRSTKPNYKGWWAKHSSQITSNRIQTGLQLAVASEIHIQLLSSLNTSTQQWTNNGRTWINKQTTSTTTKQS